MGKSKKSKNENSMLHDECQKLLNDFTLIMEESTPLLKYCEEALNNYSNNTNVSESSEGLKLAHSALKNLEEQANLLFLFEELCDYLSEAIDKNKIVQDHQAASRLEKINELILQVERENFSYYGINTRVKQMENISIFFLKFRDFYPNCSQKFIKN